MEKEQPHLEKEINDLKHDLENFQKEKERVRAIIGQIGGIPKFSTKLVNAIFIIAIIIPVVISVFAGDRLRLLMIEMATVVLSAKIIYLIHMQMKINHFKFWILSSIEWRVNEIMKQLRKSEKD